ncbi:hypothetical protein DF185_19830 [Marinifilum breve]|uniref:Uncharacterized protein n=1 Tax=Marinifilum breve TaxID=2184082 RepID=A0A2V3ZT68_9BACT|nr:hypothetical protein [Marinifilum breve]PXX96892.1 hypothetical protein DF185_19830 [Marinifilum breve]
MSNYSYNNVVKIDRSTLPKDGQRIRFEIYNYDDLVGTYIEKDDMFLLDNGQFHFIHDIFSWELIEEREAPAKKN